MTSVITLTIGLYPPGGAAPIFTTRRVPYVDLVAVNVALTTALTTGFFAPYVPLPPPEEVEPPV